MVDGRWRPVIPHLPGQWRRRARCIAPPPDPALWDASSSYDVGTSSKVYPPGEWNTYEITCKGKVLSIWTNGSMTCIADNCGALKGVVGLEAEKWRVEFRNIRLKQLA